MPKKQKLDLTEIREWILDAVQTEMEAQQASSASMITETVRNAVRKEMEAYQSRKHTLEGYTQRLHDTDAKVTDFIQQAITETTRAYRLTVNSYIVSHLAAFFILLAGLVLIFLVKGKNEGLFPVALLFIVGSVIWFISLQNRSPVKNSRYMVNHLAKLNVIFAGYIRQIHQVDAVFEEIVGNRQEITPQLAEQLLNNLQDAMSEAMTAISASNDLID